MVCTEADPKIAGWSEDGETFIVHSSAGFEQFLNGFFKGSLLTFIRQLHFYGFRKVDIKGEKWSFSHKCFRREYPHLIYEIRRKTRTETNDGIASQLEVQALRDHVGSIQELITKLQKELKETKDELKELKQHGVKRVAGEDVDSMVVKEEAAVRKKKKLVEMFDDGKDKLDNEIMRFDTLAGIFDGEGFFGDGFESILPFADSSLEQMEKR